MSKMNIEYQRRITNESRISNFSQFSNFSQIKNKLNSEIKNNYSNISIPNFTLKNGKFSKINLIRNEEKRLEKEIDSKNFDTKKSRVNFSKKFLDEISNKEIKNINFFLNFSDVKKENFFSKHKKENNELDELRKLIGLNPLKKKEKNLEKQISQQFKIEKTIYEKGYQKKIRRKRFKLKFFYDLVFILNKAFLGEKQKIHSFNLCPLKSEILYLLLSKKFKKILNPRIILKIDNESCFKKKNMIIFDLLDTQEFKCSSKRAEEKMKFVFNSTIKKLKIKFFFNNNLKNNYESEKMFFKFYFGNIENLKLLDKIFFIKNKKTKHHFNKKDLIIYFLSKKFKNEFEIYLNEYFNKIYIKSIYNKWENFFKRYERNSLSYSECCEKIISHIKKCKRVKLPWNVYEIDQAVDSFKHLINNL